MTRDEAALHFTKLKEADELIQEEYRRLGRVEEAAACAQDIEACEVALEALKTATWEPSGGMYKCTNCGNLEAAPDPYCRMCGAYCRKVVRREE